MYDFIIIDSAPVGILAETLMLMKHADLNIFVARLDNTLRETFKNTNRSLESNNFANVSVLINDLDIRRDAYKYGYNTNYYTDDKEMGFFSRLLHKTRKVS